MSPNDREVRWKALAGEKQSASLKETTEFRKLENLVVQCPKPSIPHLLSGQNNTHLLERHRGLK